MDFKDLYGAFFEESSDALLAFELPEGRIIHVNKSFCALSGLNTEELEGEPISVIHAPLPEGFERERQLDLSILGFEGLYNDIAFASRNSGMRFVSAKIKHVKNGSKLIGLAVLADDTERQLMLRDLMTKHQSLEHAYVELEQLHSQLKNTQEKMMQVSKLVALGELAAGMSHELNQPLTGIRGFSQEIFDILKTTKKPSRSQLKSLSQEIIYNADKMASLLSHLRDFARKEKQHFKESSTNLEEVSVQKCVDNVIRLLSRQLEKENIKVEIKVSEEHLVAAKIYPLEQILVNLVTNSRDALEGQDPKKPRLIRIGSELVDQQVHIRIQDTGPGIPENIRSRIFDPFFSTKELGKGMGLGLSISFGIAHNFGGELVLEESSHRGTSFLIKLPRATLNNYKAAA